MTYRLCCVDNYHILHHCPCSVPGEKGLLLSRSGSLLHGCNTDMVCSYRHELGHLDEKACHCTMANSDHTKIKKNNIEGKYYFFTLQNYYYTLCICVLVYVFSLLQYYKYWVLRNSEKAYREITKSF